MPEDVNVSTFVTKQLVIKDGTTDRFFEGILSAEIKDRQGEITDIEELYKALPVWMERNAPMSDTHSNRIIGRGINFEKVTITTKNGERVPAIKILGKIHSNTTLDDYIWEQIKSGNYKGLSFGGATKANREPIVQSDGSMAYRLKDLEIYEVAVCEDPAVAFALITDINPMAKSNEVNKAYHVEKDNEELKVKCDGTSCYINAEVQKNYINKNPDAGAPATSSTGEARDELKPKETEVYIGEPNKETDEDKDKSFFGSKEEDMPLTEVTGSEDKPEDKTKPLPTKWGKMEFDSCEEHAKKDPQVKNPGGYCGSIQQHVDKDNKYLVDKNDPIPHMIDTNGQKWYLEKDIETLLEKSITKDTKVHAGKEEYGSTESCISGEGKKPGIKDPQAYCGSRHNDEHGMNPNDDKHKADHIMGSTGVGNGCDSKCNEKHGKTFEEREKDIVGTGTENPRGLGAYNTSINGSGTSNQITSREITDPARLGDPDKLENTPKKPKDPTVKSVFEEAVMKYWEENKNSDNNSDLHIAIKDFIENWKPEE